jgi:prevent-host-death family protein
MIKVTSAEFQRNIGRYHDKALVEPVAVTRRGRTSAVLLSFEEYERMRRRDRVVMTLDDFTDQDIIALESATIPEESRRFDHEVE